MVYNRTKVDEVKKSLNKETLSDDEFFYYLYDLVMNNCDAKLFKKQISYIGEGSARMVYNVNDICALKVSVECDNWDTMIDVQGVVEVHSYKKHPDDIAEIYGHSDNYIVELVELCNTEYSLQDLCDYFGGWIEEEIKSTVDYSEEDLQRDVFEVCDECYESYRAAGEIMEEAFDGFNDISFYNIGIAQDGAVKIIDAGYGTEAEYEKEEFLEYLLKSTDKVLFGATNWCWDYAHDHRDNERLA